MSNYVKPYIHVCVWVYVYTSIVVVVLLIIKVMGFSMEHGESLGIEDREG